MVERADQQCRCLDELLVLFLLFPHWKIATDVKALIVGEDYPANCEKFINDLFQELSAFASHNNYRLKLTNFPLTQHNPQIFRHTLLSIFLFRTISWSSRQRSRLRSELLFFTLHYDSSRPRRRILWKICKKWTETLQGWRRKPFIYVLVRLPPQNYNLRHERIFRSRLIIL